MSNNLLTHQLQGDRGEVVLLLNGGMMTHGSWAPVTAGLMDAYRVLGCDFRGQLLTPGDGHRRLEDNVDDLVALLDALDLAEVHVLGTSFGGEVSVLLAAAHPSRVRTLAVVTAVDRTPPGMAEDAGELAALAQDVVESGDAGPFHDVLVAGIYSADYRETHAEDLAERREKLGTLPASWFQGLLGILASIEDFDLTAALGKIRCPTLVVGAAEDKVMPEEQVRALADAIDGAELRMHPTAGHVLVMEDPAWLTTAYRDFLACRVGDLA